MERSSALGPAVGRGPGGGSALLRFTILSLSVLLQVAAAALAWRLIRTTGRMLAWILLSSALVLMAGRRVLAFLMAEFGWAQAESWNDLLGLGVSAFMLGAVWHIKGHFEAMLARESLLAERESHNRALFQHAGDAMEITDPEGHFLDLNHAACEGRGYLREELLGRAPEAVGASWSEAELRKLAAEAFEKGDLRVESWRQNADGSRYPVEVHARPIAFKRSPAILSVVRDITERRAAEAELRAANASACRNQVRLDALLRLTESAFRRPAEALASGLEEAVRLTGSRHGAICRVDEERRTFTLLAGSVEAVGAWPGGEACSWDAGSLGPWDEVLRRQAPFQVHLGEGKGEGPARDSFLGVPVLREGTVVAVAAVAGKAGDYEPGDEELLRRFIDGLWNLHGRLQAEGALREARKAEGLVQMASGVAHDFNNLFQVVLTHMELASGVVEEGSRAQLHLEKAMATLNTAKDLAQKIQHFSGGSLRRPEATDLSALVEAFRNRPGSERVSWNLGPGLPRVPMDRGQIRAVAEALIQNAVETGGPVSVRSYQRWLEHGDFSAGVWAGDLVPGAYVVLEISDQGPGIPAEGMGHLYDPFFSTKGAGRGMGLPSALGLVKGHRGNIQVLSQAGVGSVFRVHLPQEARPAEEIPQTRSPAGLLTGPGAP